MKKNLKSVTTILPPLLEMKVKNKVQNSQNTYGS